MKEYTPTPWRHEYGSQIYATSDDINVATVNRMGSREEQIANAAFIVRAVNAHEQLVEAIRQISIRANTPDGGQRNMDRMLTEIADIAGNALQATL